MEGKETLLEVIQDDLPLVPKPFAALGSRCGMREDGVINELKRLQQDGYLREISAILDGKRLGFQSSLVAVRIPNERLGRMIPRINAHPGVSHNYERDHEYNVWFTLAVPRSVDFSEVISGLIGDDTGAENVLILPALKTYKLRVRLPSSRGVDSNRTAGIDTEPTGAPKLSESETRLLRVLERPFHIVPRLWRDIADAAAMDEASVMALVEKWKRAGIIRRVAGVLRHRRIGYTANAMSCFALPTERIDAAGYTAAKHTFVSHCYHRQGSERWSLPLFAMIHAKQRHQCLEYAALIAGEIEADTYEVLFSLREFKKERVRYFTGVIL